MIILRALTMQGNRIGPFISWRELLLLAVRGTIVDCDDDVDRLIGDLLVNAASVSRP